MIALTPKAFDTLLVLVSHAGEVVEKDELLRAVWPGIYVEEATLAQNISTLRKALGDAPDASMFIATVPRRGYRFVAPIEQAPDPEEPIARGRAADAPIVRSEIQRQTPAVRRQRFWISISALFGAALIFGVVRGTWKPLPPATPVVFANGAPEGTSFSTSGGFMAMAPDGRSVAFVASGSNGVPSLWLRRFDALAEQQLSGTEGALQPFWSYDSKFVAFFADGQLKKVDIAHGAAQTICQLPVSAEPRSGTWNRKDEILFAHARQGIFEVAAAGGVATAVIENDAENIVDWPQFLPDNRHFLYVVHSAHAEKSGIYVGALGSIERVQVSDLRSFVQYSPTGHLLFVRNGILLAQRFDDRTFRLEGTPVAIAHGVAFNSGTARGAFSLSETGVLAYRSVSESRLLWFDREGTERGEVGQPGGYLQFSVSPDGRNVAAARLNPRTGGSDIWVMDANGAGERRLTFDSSSNTTPLWSADGSSIAFNSNRDGQWNILAKAVSGDGPDHPMVSVDSPVFPQQWYRDGRLLFRKIEHGTKGDFWILEPGGSAKLTRLPVFKSDEDAGQISPDGRWLAYASYETAWVVSVRPVASIESRWQIAAEGAEPRWRADGKELYYLSPELSLMAVPIETGSSFRAAPTQEIFKTRAVAPSGLAGQAYDVNADGSRFLVKVPATLPSITVVVNAQTLFPTDVR